MIKQINYQNILVTPFLAKKEWSLSNIDPDNNCITEDYVGGYYVGGETTALDYVDYDNGPFINRENGIALEQQPDNNVIYQEGIETTGTFDVNSDPKNMDGTFKRSVYDQTKVTFYNTYRNPILLFGMEYMDIQLSRTQRYISNSFRILNIPRSIFGDKIDEGSVTLVDNTLDDLVTLQDDSNGNLIASANLFSRIQEVRVFPNNVLAGLTSHECDSPIVPTTTTTSTTPRPTTTTTSTTTTTPAPTTTSTTTSTTTTSTTTTSTTTPGPTTTSTTTTSTTTPTTTTTSTTTTAAPTTTSTTTTSTTITTAAPTTTTTAAPPVASCFDDNAKLFSVWTASNDGGGGCGCADYENECSYKKVCDLITTDVFDYALHPYVSHYQAATTESNAKFCVNDHATICGNNSVFNVCWDPVMTYLMLYGWAFVTSVDNSNCAWNGCAEEQQTMVEVTIRGVGDAA
jgi:hypothetical protein